VSKLIGNEFDFLLENEDDIDIDYEADSINYIIQAEKLKNKDTVYGIKAEQLFELFCFNKTVIMPWKHVTMYLDTSRLNDINGDRIVEFSVFDFVEELNTFPNEHLGFGYNNSHRNMLTSINIPKNLVVINDNVFAFYKRLKNITFESGSKLLRLGARTFACCEKLTKLDLSKCEFLDTIPEMLLYESGVKELCISSNITNIHKRAFDGCKLSTVYVDDDKFTFEEFMARLIENNYEPFWGTASYDF